MSSLWYPSGYCERYGFQWCSPPYDGPPHYPTLPSITVIDASSRVLGLRRRRFWKAALDEALADWEAAGLLFPVTRDPGLAYQAGCITVCITPTPDGTGGYAAFGMTPGDALHWPDPGAEAPLVGVGWAHIDTDEFDKMFRAKDSGGLRALIGHEVGHTFGFGHAPARACMDTDVVHNTRPTAEEIAALNTYFFGGGQ